MIKVELTKNIFVERAGLFGLKPVQIVFTAVGLIIGGLTLFWLMQCGLSTDLIGWIVFIEMTIIGLGVVRPGGVDIFSFLMSSLKPDTRYFSYQGEFDDEE